MKVYVNITAEDEICFGVHLNELPIVFEIPKMKNNRKNVYVFVVSFIFNLVLYLMLYFPCVSACL